MLCPQRARKTWVSLRCTEAIVPLLEFLEELLCDGLLVSEERADVIKGLVGQVGQAVSEVTRALTASLMIKVRRVAA